MSNPERMAQWMWNALKVRIPLETVDGGRDIAKDVEATEQRLYRELDSGADRPGTILARRSYVASEIRNLRQRVDKSAHDDEKAPLLQRIKEMEQTVSQTEAAGMQRALAALRKDVADAEESVNLATSLADVDRKSAYKLAADGAAKVFASETDWQAQIKQGRSLPGIGTLVKPFQDLRRQRELLDDLVGGLLPKLTSKIKPVLPDAVEVIEPAPESHVIAEGGELQAILDAGGDWADAKAVYGRYKNEMSKLARFRKTVVDQWLNHNLTAWDMKLGTGTGWVAVGSDDPTSDYDISVNRHGLKGEGRAQKVYHDYQVVKDFNAHFRKEYGCETGTIFDTNLYASAPPLVPGPPENGSEEEQAAYEDVVGSNDVGALMKQRRYMSGAEFNAYRDQVLDGLPDRARAQMARRFEMAEDNYGISLLKTIEVMRGMLEKASQRGELSENQQKARDIIEEFDRGRGKSGTEMIGATDVLEHVAHQLMHECKDASTMSTNEIYADTKGDLREAEIKVDTLQRIRADVDEFLRTLAGDFEQDTVTALLEQLADGLEALSTAAADDVRKGIAKGDRTGLIDGVIAAQNRIQSIAPELLSDLARAQTLNMFFANEAYQSGGPFKHVVYAGQAVETDLKSQPNWDSKSKEEQAEEIKRLTTLRRAELTASERLDSFNEQLGDFLKDLAHYGDADPGVAIIQSSKYLDRLIDAAALIDEKGLFDSDGSLQSDIRKQVARQGDIRRQLIAARKGKLVMEPMEEGGGEVDQVEQRRAFACDFMRKMGINSVAGLGRTYSDLGMRVNVAVRKALAST